MRADLDDEVGNLAAEEAENGRRLHQNYVKKRGGNRRKAGEHLWGAINNLLSALSRLERGTGFGKHEKVRTFALDWIAADDRVESEAFVAAENLHRNYYHDFLHAEEWDDLTSRALQLYDVLETTVSNRLFG